MTDRAWLPFFPGWPAWYRLQSPLPIDPQVTTPSIWVVYYTIQRINYLKTIGFHCFGSRMSCLFGKLREEGIPHCPTRHSMTSSSVPVHVLQSAHFLFDNLKFCVWSFEEIKKRSDSCFISVNYGHFYVGVWNTGLIFVGKFNRHRIEQAVINTLSWRLLEIEVQYLNTRV